GIALLQELDRDAVRRADERHAPVARRPVDRHALVHQPLAGGVDVVHLIGEVAEIAPARIVFRVPVVGQLDQRRLAGDAGFLVLRRGEEDERIAPLAALVAANLLQPELVAVEIEGFVQIFDADHRVEITHRIHVPVSSTGDDMARPRRLGNLRKSPKPALSRWDMLKNTAWYLL